MEEIIEASHDGFFITDGQGIILKVNTSWERIAVISRDFAVGKCAQNLVNDKWYTESSVMAAIRERKKVTIMLEMLRGEKVGQKILATAIPIWDDKNQTSCGKYKGNNGNEYLKRSLEKTQPLNKRYAAELEQTCFVSYRSVAT